MEGLTGHGAIRFMGNLRNEGARPDVPSVFRRSAPWQSELPPTDRREYFASEPLVDKETINPNKAVSIALDEIAAGKIAYHRTREGIK